MVEKEITIDMVKSYTYEGDDKMINLKSSKLPPVNKNFKATLKLKKGGEINAPKEWRMRIWKWWYWSRYDELVKNQNRMMVDVANSMLNQKHKIRYNNDKT